MAVSNASTSTTTNAGEWELVITRVFEALRDLVFKARTESKRLMRWIPGPGSPKSW
jgi:uncharacterized protein YndB with AHSA1/START domain